MNTVVDSAPALELPVLRSSLLSSVPGIVHGFTRRVPGLGRADANVGYSPPRDAEDAWRMRRAWAAAIGVDADRLVTAGQVHGGAVLRAAPADAGLGARPGSGRLGLGDALIADEPGPVLWSLHADCLPLLLVDPGRADRRPRVAAIHAGWRGTVADVAGAAVRAMASAFGTRPQDLLVFAGPAIGACCYEVGAEVVEAWRVAAPDGDDALASADGRTTFDLVRANEFLLARAGVRAEHIDRAGICTRCAGHCWFSHRGQGPTTGRFAAVIAVRD